MLGCYIAYELYYAAPCHFSADDRPFEFVMAVCPGPVWLLKDHSHGCWTHLPREH